MMTNVMVKTCLDKKIIKNSNLIKAMKNNVCPKARVIRRPNFSENRICLKIYRMFRSVDWTHDMVIVKWHLFIYSFDTSANFALWQMRHRFNPRKRVNDYQRYSMLGAQVYVLYPRQFIFALNCKRRSFLQVLQSIRRIFWKIFCVSDDGKCYGENMS